MMLRGRQQRPAAYPWPRIPGTHRQLSAALAKHNMLRVVTLAATRWNCDFEKLGQQIQADRCKVTTRISPSGLSWICNAVIVPHLS